MRTLKIPVIMLAAVVMALACNAQQNAYVSIFHNQPAYVPNAALRFYGGLSHQHQNYFNKAFSLQGIEGGIILNDKIFVGVYGSAFVSNHEIAIENNPMYILMNQAGLAGGFTCNSTRLLHAGILLNIGCFSLAGNDKTMPVFKSGTRTISLSGVVISPQAFAEINVTGWQRFRTGLAYNFYSYSDHSQVRENDLEKASINFGFLFGRFF
jgi:hypothetical protein